MASTEEVLKALQNAKITTLAATEPEELVIDAESRTITVPSSERLFGVTGDKDVERKYFQCPKIVGDNIDLSQHQIYISYVFTTSENNTIFPTIGNGRYHCEDVEVSGDNITFSWLLSGNVLSNPGFIAFKVMAMKNEGDELKTKWNTAPAFGTVLITVPDGEDIAEEYPDVINQIFDRLDALESGGGGGTGGTTNYNNLSNKPKLNGVTLEGNKTLDQVGVLAKNQGASNSGKYLSVGSDGNVVPADAPSGGTVDPEQIKQAVNGYLEENPVSGMTAEQEQQLNQNTQDVTDLKSAINQKGLPEGGTTGQVLAKKSDEDYDAEWTAVEGGSPSGRGWTLEQVAMLETLGKYLVYTDQTTGQSILDGLISSLRESSGGTTEPGVYTITKELTNVTIDNESTSVTSGSTYAASLTASDGYYIESVIITMGGQNITQSAYSEGKINIGSVTGNIVIIANGTLLDNLIKLSECTSGNERMPDGSIVTEGEMLVTPLVKVNPDTIYKTNINKNLPDGSITYHQKIFAYGVDKDFKRANQLSNNVPYGVISDAVVREEEEWVRILFSIQNENPYFGLKGVV